MAIDKSAFDKYLAEFPDDMICPLQIWYEGLNGLGVPSVETVEAIESALDAAGGWTNIGEQRYEKFGLQNSWRNPGNLRHIAD